MWIYLNDELHKAVQNETWSLDIGEIMYIALQLQVFSLLSSISGPHDFVAPYDCQTQECSNGALVDASRLFCVLICHARR